MAKAQTQHAGGNLPAPVPQTRKEKIDSYVVKTLEHLQSLIETGNMVFPKDYSVENACKGAALYLAEAKDKDGNFVLDVCTPSSIVNSIMGMTIDGLSVWKKQGYFIPYGKELHWQPNYNGNVVKAKRDADVKEVNAHTIYEGDEFVYQVDQATGRMKLVKHETALENRDNSKIKGAYALVVFNDGTTTLEVMSMPEIKRSWMQGFGGGNTKAHQNFTDEMCEKTVTNRAVKPLNQTADDSEIMPEDTEEDKRLKAREKDIKGKTGKKELEVHDTVFEEVKDAPPEQGTMQGPSPEPGGNLSDLGKGEEKPPEGPGY